jgi:hypothetical protein
MQSDQPDSEWYRPDKTEVAPADLLVLMELAGVVIQHVGSGVFIHVKGTAYRVPLDEDGTWERNAYEIWQHLTRNKY